MKSKPSLSFWQLWNISFGFLGLQFGFALQNANVSRILTDLGADLHSLSLFWIVAPLTGLIVQPIVGAASDRTWNRFGRRRPYMIAGAMAAAIGMLLMPNAPAFVSIMAPMIFGALMLALMDASFNVSFLPFRSLVADLVPEKQRNAGYSIQAVLINIGAVVGSMLPFILTNVVGLDNVSRDGNVASSVVWSFYIGATVLLGSVLWTVIRTKEHAPETHYQMQGMDHQAVIAEQQKSYSFKQRCIRSWRLLRDMPETMRQFSSSVFFLVCTVYYVGIHHTGDYSTSLVNRRQVV